MWYDTGLRHLNVPQILSQAIQFTAQKGKHQYYVQISKLTLLLQLRDCHSQIFPSQLNYANIIGVMQEFLELCGTARLGIF